MNAKINFVTIGHWALIAGIVLAILAGVGFEGIPQVIGILFVLGLAVGFLNVTEKESTPFLVAVIALLLIGVAGLQLGQLTGVTASILTNFISFIAAAGLVVALKQVIVLAKPTS